ncbi:class II fructose-bisphosphate aldolase [Rhizobium sp. AG207R]|uniref:class II fructose-bisphosphate aldolase n=1 Tax=Rhizobium sp. AG207R TaxID=2802287 RepID=UPI0022ABC6A4|nr:class II fructose-bisphosphate aldolase [Rhizobium sp. AG207R]MCZ3374328.1 class II fructose-bisphosphate aldolase [Rhizobium sp. AG207R]
MKLVPMKKLMDAAYEGKYAVPAFNCASLEMIQCVLQTAAKLRSPVILGIHPVEVAYFGNASVPVAIAKSVGADLDIEVAIHLDHGDSEKSVMGAIRGGFSSVMYDGSHLPIEQNVENSRRIVEIAHAVGVTVEGEIGTIGNTDEFGNKLENAHLSDPDWAERLANTGIDCLAVAIGNAHGFYAEEPRLRFDLVEEIRQRIKIPMVLHGGTGIPYDQVQRAIKMGVAKMNVGTALRYAFVKAAKDTCDTEPTKDLPLMTVGTAGIAAGAEVVQQYMEMTMSAGRLR